MQRWKRRLAGAAAILGLIAAAAVLLIRTTGLSPGYVELRTFTDDASGLMDGTQVRLNGIPIGYLETQKLTGSRDPARKVELVLKVRGSYLEKIPDDSIIALASDNLLGDSFVGIHRGQSPRAIQAGAELPMNQAQDITKLMARMSQQLNRFNAIAARANKLIADVNAGQGTIGKFINEGPPTGEGLPKELDALMNDVQKGHGTLSRLMSDEDSLTAQMRSPSQRLDAIMAMAGHVTGDQMKELNTSLTAAQADFKTLQAELAAGKGSLGKLSDFQQKLDSLGVKWSGMMDRINSGQGTAGQLMVNPQLNEALQGTTRELQAFAAGLKANPRKYISIKIF